MKAAIPEYSVRRSPKAKNLRLKVTREDGLLVVIPKGYDDKQIPSVLKRKKEWIADAMERIRETKRFLEPKPRNHLPEQLRLVALGESWRITYMDDKSHTGTRLRVEGGKIVISGTELNRETVIRKLKDWLRLKVKDELFPLAESLATKHRLPLGGLLVKSQRTRWASCSAKKNLSLNTKLLFIPPDLLRYVLIHELCHTVHMNHGSDFWRLVECHEPGFKALDARLRTAWKSVPSWLFE